MTVAPGSSNVQLVALAVPRSALVEALAAIHCFAMRNGTWPAELGQPEGAFHEDYERTRQWHRHAVERILALSDVPDYDGRGGYWHDAVTLDFARRFGLVVSSSTG